MRKMILWFYTGLTCLFLIVPIFKYTVNQLRFWEHYDVSLLEKFNALDHTFFKNLVFIQTLPAKKHILTFDQSLVYRYTKALFIPYLDRRLLPVYSAKTKKEVYQLLKAMDIDYVDTFAIDPVLINSKLMDMLNDPSYAHLIFQSYKKIYHLNARYKLTQTTPIDFTSLLDLKYFFNNKKIILSTPHLHINKEIASPFIQLPFKNLEIMNNNHIYMAQLNLSGSGFYKVLCNEYGKNNTFIQSGVIFEDVLNHQTRKRTIQFLLSPMTEKFNLVLQLNGVGKLKLNDLNLSYFSKDKIYEKWILREPIIDNLMQVHLKPSSNVFLLKEKNNGFTVGHSELKIPMIVSSERIENAKEIDFSAKGQGDVNIYIVHDGEIIAKVNKDNIHLHENYHTYHYLISTKSSNYQIGFQLMNPKKTDYFSLKFFKYV